MERVISMPALVENRVVTAALVGLIAWSSASARSADAPITSTPLAMENAAATRRESHTLTRQEIFEAIQDNLAERGVSGRAQLQPGDLKIQSSIRVDKDDSGLQVKHVSYDPLRRQTVFELRTAHEQQCLPFTVTTRRNLQISGIALLTTGEGELQSGSVATFPGQGRSRSTPLVLAKPGTPSTLVMEGQNVRITITVMPLQPGLMGQHILVRDTATTSVMKAVVVGEGLLQSSF
jgi:hypothetical protein